MQSFPYERREKNSLQFKSKIIRYKICIVEELRIKAIISNMI